MNRCRLSAGSFTWWVMAMKHCTALIVSAFIGGSTGVLRSLETGDFFPLQKFTYVLARNRIGDSARSADCALARALHEYAVDDSVDRAVGGVVQRAAAVARISGAIKLKD